MLLCAKEAVWMRKLLRAFGVPCAEPMMILEDNQGCIAIATNQRGMSSRTKHVATRYFAVRQFVDDREIMVDYTPSADQVADIFTKPLDCFFGTEGRLTGEQYIYCIRRKY